MLKTVKILLCAYAITGCITAPQEQTEEKKEIKTNMDSTSKLKNSNEELYKQERKISKDISKVYNSGNMKKAVEMSVQFMKDYPNSFYAKAKYAVMHGDASYNTRLPKETREKYMQIAKEGTANLYQSPDFAKFPEKFKTGIRNEYYWFHELHMEQYQLGLEKLKNGQEGDYSATVGSSMLSYKKLLNSEIEESHKWAEISLKYFKSFEKKHPTWYNINYFAAQSLACLGRYDEALEAFRKMYKKQKSQVDQYEVDEFKTTVDEIKKILSNSK